MPSLLAFLHEDHPTFTQTSAGDFIKAIITISANASQNEQSCIGPNSLTRQLVSDECIETLIANMLRGGNPLTVGVGIIIEVIRKNNSDYDPEIQAGQELPPSTSDPIYLGTLLRRFAQHVPDFMALILSPNHTILQGETSVSVKRKPLVVASGESIEPLGFDRFKTCELMAELLHCSNMGLLNERGSEAYIQQRDNDRDRLRAEGALARPHEPQSAVTEFSEDGSSFDTDAPESDSPTTRRLEVTNSAEDDGFEEVVSEDFPSEGNEVPEVPGPEEHKPTTTPSKARLSLEDEFFDEPLGSPHKNEARVESPTAAMASKVEGLNIHGAKSDPPAEGHPADEAEYGSTDEIVSQIDAQLQPESKATDAGLLKPTESHNGGLAASPLSMSPNLNDQSVSLSISPDVSPNPNDTPAPLFSPRGAAEAAEGEAQGEAVEQGEVGEFAPEDELAPFVPHLENDVDGRPIVGDFLKRQFVDHHVVPTIIVRSFTLFSHSANRPGLLLPLPLEQLPA